MPRQLLAAYEQARARYDEMFEAPSVPRAHWRAAFDQLLSVPPERMRERVESVQRQIRENGVTYNVYADSKGADRPWDLDVLPLILSHEEWRQIEAAVVQRATLLNRILLDIYGGHSLLTEGLLPPALVYGHAGFLRPCCGERAAGERMLHLYAADLARSPDGQWWVVADRTQAPSGAGYAMENRQVISRAFPELFRDLRVRNLSHFFATLRDGLAHWAPRAEGPPLMVLLTPGPYNETYFEHAYLARQLGFALVEGPDLTVRDGCVWLKTLSGLQRVHVILRRLDDDFCDPLELRADSALGVAGLADAVRRGNVLVSNALGSNLLESGALLGFLPALCERLLGEPLRMPSVATWWCGEPAALEDAIKHLERLVIKPAFPQLRAEAVFGEDFSGARRDALIAQLRERPHGYVAQELVRFSQAPVWDRQHPRRLLARDMGLRVFACASPDGYVVMPGGLARVGTGSDARVVSMQRGGSSKDVWVLADTSSGTPSVPRRAGGAHDLIRAGANLSSRMIENLFWFGRYSERCNNTARLLRITLGRLIDESAAKRSGEWQSLMAMCRFAELLDTDEDEFADDELEQNLLAAVTDEEKPGLAGSMRQLFRVAFQLRERLSADNWRTINQVVQDLSARKGPRQTLSGTLAELDRTVVALMTLAGFAMDGMTRDQGWRFMSIGRRVERLQFLCMVLQQACSSPGAENLDWVLDLADSTITYRSRYMARPEWAPTLDLLVRDESNPRSVAFQLYGLHDFLGRLAEASGPCGEDLLQPCVESMRALEAPDLQPRGPRLRVLLRDVYAASFALSERLELRFFCHVSEVNRGTFAT